MIFEPFILSPVIAPVNSLLEATSSPPRDRLFTLVDQFPNPIGGQRQMAGLDAEGSQRRSYSIRDNAANRNHTALTAAFRTQRIARRR
jgi:hypothetical protein